MLGEQTEVYFGPESRVNLALLLLASLTALLGLLAASPFWSTFAWWDVGKVEDEEESSQQLSHAQESPSLARHPAVSQSLSKAFPFFIVSTMILFVFSDLGLGTVVNIVFEAQGETTTIGPAFSFSVLTLSRDSLKGPGGGERVPDHFWQISEQEWQPSSRYSQLVIVYIAFGLIDLWLL